MLNNTFSCVVTEDEMNEYVHTAGYICFGLLALCGCCIIKLACK